MVYNFYQNYICRCGLNQPLYGFPYGVWKRLGDWRNLQHLLKFAKACNSTRQYWLVQKFIFNLSWAKKDIGLYVRFPKILTSSKIFTTTCMYTGKMHERLGKISFCLPKSFPKLHVLKVMRVKLNEGQMQRTIKNKTLSTWHFKAGTQH